MTALLSSQGIHPSAIHPSAPGNYIDGKGPPVYHTWNFNRVRNGQPANESTGAFFFFGVYKWEVFAGHYTNWHCCCVLLEDEDTGARKKGETSSIRFNIGDGVGQQGQQLQARCAIALHRHHHRSLVTLIHGHPKAATFYHSLLSRRNPSHSSAHAETNSSCLLKPHPSLPRYSGSLQFARASAPTPTSHPSR